MDIAIGVIMTWVCLAVLMLFGFAMLDRGAVREQVKTNQTITVNEIKYKCERVEK